MEIKFIERQHHIQGIIRIVGAGSKPALNHDGTNMPHDGGALMDCYANDVGKRAGLEPAPTARGSKTAPNNGPWTKKTRIAVR